MPLLKCQSSKSTPQKVMSYVTDPTKAEYISVQNLFEDEDYAKQFTETMKRFHKGEKYDERKYYHFKLSCNRKDKVLHQEAHLFAEELAAKLFFDFECVIATHTDTQTMDDEKTSKIYCAAANLRNEIPATDICRISVKMQPSMYNRKEKTCFIDDIMGFQKEEEIKAFIKKTLDSCLFVYPKFYTEREKMQQSVFMIMPNKIFDTTDKIDFENENWKTKLENESSILRRYKFLPKLHNPLLAQAVEVSEIEDNDYGDILWELVIPNNVVCKLKKRLDNMGIDEAFLFPENLENTAKKVELKYKQELQESLIKEIKEDMQKKSNII